MWREAVQRARATGSTVLVARPAESEAKLSLAGLADLLADIADEALVDLPAPQRAAIDAVLLRADGGGSLAQRVVGTAVVSLMRRLAAEAPVVVAIDDVQWLDAPSAAVVEFALRRLADATVCALVSLRSQEVERSGSG